MAKQSTKQPKPPVADTDNEEVTDATVQLHQYDGDTLVGMLNRRIEASKEHWNKEKLHEVRKRNDDWYHSEGVKMPSEDPDTTNDNRIFSSIRTIIPFTTNRITEPETHPSSKSPQARAFAADLRQILQIHAENEDVATKLSYALLDAINKRGGYLKPRYDPNSGSFCTIEYVECESIIIDHVSKPYQEPRYFRHVQKKTIEDLLIMFPERKQAIYRAFNLNNPTLTDLETEETIFEDWAFIRTPDNEVDLIVCWHTETSDVALGAVRDPNWDYDGNNFLKSHQMPLIFVNVLSEGRSHVDKTSFTEQAIPAQHTLNKRRRQIGSNAGLGSVGMPVVDSRAIAADQTDFLTFEEDQALVLDVENSGVDDIRKVFTTWTAESLSPDVYKDAQDAIETIQNTFGASNILQGQASDNKTLGQDELVRDTSAGRLQEVIKAVDRAMARLYPFIAQFLLLYGDEQQEFPFIDDSGDFDYVMIQADDIDPRTGIRVKNGTGVPVDNVQRRMVMKDAASNGFADPLSYWETMDESNARKYTKRFMEYSSDPVMFMKTVDDDVFDRDAYVDIMLVKRGKQPPYREALSQDYFNYLNRYVLSDDINNPMTPNKDAIKAFIQEQLARGERMLGLAESQLPTPEEMDEANAKADAAAQAEAATLGAGASAPGAPTAPTGPTAPVPANAT